MGQAEVVGTDVLDRVEDDAGAGGGAHAAGEGDETEGDESEPDDSASDSTDDAGADEPEPDDPDARATRERQAVAYVRQAFEFGMIDAQWFRIDRRFDSLRANPAFTELLARLERLLRAQGLSGELGESD